LHSCITDIVAVIHQCLHCSTLFPYTTLFRPPQERSLQMLRAIATQAEQQAFNSEYGFTGGGANHALEGFTEYELHMRPTREWPEDRKSTRLNSSHVKISYAVFCLKKKRI